MRCAALAVTGTLAALTVRRDGGAFAVLIGVAVLSMMGVLAMELLKPVAVFADNLRDAAGISRGVYEPVIKSVAIGFLTELGTNICEDAGERSIGNALQLSGSVAAFYVLLPLMQSVLDLMEEIL